MREQVLPGAAIPVHLQGCHRRRWQFCFRRGAVLVPGDGQGVWRHSLLFVLPGLFNACNFDERKVLGIRLTGQRAHVHIRQHEAPVHSLHADLPGAAARGGSRAHQ